MKFLILVVASLLSACIHPPAPTVPTGEEISKTSGEAARKNLSEGSPALYSTSAAKEDESPAEAPMEPAVVALQVIVYPDGSFRVDGVAIKADSLSTALESRESRGPLEFLASEQVLYGKLVDAMDVAKSVGYSAIVLKPLPAVPPTEPAP